MECRTQGQGTIIASPGKVRVAPVVPASIAAADMVPERFERGLTAPLPVRLCCRDWEVRTAVLSEAPS